MKAEIKEFMDALKARTVGESEFHQAVQEVIETVWDTYQANPKYKANKILEKMVEPERVIMFRVPWIDDKGEVQINRGLRNIVCMQRIKVSCWGKMCRHLRIWTDA